MKLTPKKPFDWGEWWEEQVCRYWHSHFHWHPVGSSRTQQCAVCNRRYSDD